MADQTCEQPGSSKKKRQVTKPTFEKWQREHEREHQTLSWLRCQLDDGKAHVKSLYCATCKRYEARIRSMKNFTSTWITGSTNLKVSNVIDHATSAAHKASMSHLRDDRAKASGESPMMSSAIGRCLSTLDEESRVRMKTKFDVCYVMAKESMPLAKYPALMELEARHNVDIGPAYNTPDSAKAFTSYIASSQRQAFLSMLSSSGSHFFSFLVDGTTDAGNKEEELVVLVFFARDDTTEEITSRTRYLSVHNPEKADASGLLQCIGDALKLLGVDDVLDKDSVLGVEGKPVLVGGGTDGASVNVGVHNGLRGRMQQALPWLLWSWCFAHRLELACKDAFSSPLYASIDEMLLRLFYVYQKSPKKTHELTSIATDLKEVYEFPAGGNLPVRCHGTRWITHKRKALQRVLDRYGAYIAHFSTLTEDTSLQASDRCRLKGYLLKWREAKILVGCAMYTEVLKPVYFLSLALQREDADIVASIESTLKSVKALKSLSQQDPTEWPTVRLVKSRIKKVGSQEEYQGAVLHNLDAGIAQCKVSALADLRRLDQKIKERLEWSDTELLRAILVFIETQNWLQRDDRSSDDDGMTDIRTAVEFIVSVFRIPLEAKGMCVATIQDQLEEVVGYARKYLPIGTENYRKIWYKLHVCPDSSNWPNVLLLCELVFSLPFSTSRVEQIFSLLKIVKTKRRTNLHTSTLNDLLEISVEGPSLCSFSADAAVDLWWKDCSTTRRMGQNPRKEYRPRASRNEDSAEDDSGPEDAVLALDEWDDWFN